MAIPNPYQQYQKNSVAGTNPGQLTLMLYNGAIKFIKTAMACIEKKNLGGTSNAIIRAQDIIIYLRETLDHRYEISKNLDRLYDYFYRRLVEANIKKDISILEEISSLVEDLRDTWMTVLRKS